MIVSTIGELPALDGAIVATTTSTHAGVIEELLDRGIPVYTEKPLTNDPGDRGAPREGGPGHALRHGQVALPRRCRSSSRRSRASAGSERVRADHGPARLGRPHDDVDPVWVLAPHDLSIALEVMGAVPRPRAAVAELSADSLVGLSALLDGPGYWHAFEVSSRSPDRSRRVELHCEEGVVLLADAWNEHVTVYRNGDFGA